MELLAAIRQENPYTFALADESLRAIAHERTLRATKDYPHSGESHSGSAWSSRQQGNTYNRASYGMSGPTSSPIEDTQHGGCRDSLSNPPTATSAAQFQDLGEFLPERQWHSEKAIRDRLGVRNKQELLAWLCQDWVLDVCEAYCAAQLDTKRMEEQKYLDAGGEVAPGRKRSSAKFLINSSVLALHSKAARYTEDLVNTSNWSADDHDIRFIVRLVQHGRYASRWWENWGEAKHTAALCCTAYQILCWLRHIHRLSSGPSASNQVQRAIANHWQILLRTARAERRKIINESAKANERRHGGGGV
ncbi:hypothetical protein N431DRAFT_509922 [Stipitochalara longipes BDJ]|nr:hypothetical protein N431DRAFT_509922 [Stipitochalara longipes BDJ]